MEAHREMHLGKVHHKLIKKFKSLHIASKLLIVGFIAFAFLSSAVVALGMNGVSVANWVMQYDESGNSKWFEASPSTAPLPEINDFTAEQVIEKINEKRTEDGLNALSSDPLLTQAANTKADDMMQKNYYAYDAPDGKDAWAPITNAGYDYNWASAQLAHSYTFVTELIDAWLADESIKKDLLEKSKYSDIGVAIKHGNYQGGDTNLIVVYLASKQSTTRSNTSKTSTTAKITPYNSDPVITCNFQHLGGKPLKQSECRIAFECQINSQWYIYTSRDKCNKDQDSFYRNKYGGSGSYTIPTYAPLPTSSYPGYSNQPYATPTMSEQEAQSIIDQHNSDVQSCRSDVVSQYNSLLQNCNQYGGSSAYDACRSVYEGQRQSAYNACGSTY